MDAAQINLLISVGVPLIIALTSYLTYLSHRTAGKVEALEANTNHLLDVSKAVAHAAGIEEGQLGASIPPPSTLNGKPT